MFDADAYRDELPEPVWRADLYPVNASKLTMDWIEGAEIVSLEKSLPDLSAGMLREMFRNLVWVLQGFASIIAAATDPRNLVGCENKVLGNSELRKFPRVIRRLGYRVAEGLPDDVLWMTNLNMPGEKFRIFRHEIIALRKLEYSSPEQIMLSSSEASNARINAFSKVKPAPEAKSNWLRDSCRSWKQTQRKRMAEKHLNRAKRCPNSKLVEAYYDRKGTDFEKVFENILTILNIKFEKLDNNTKTGAPDYLVLLEKSPPLIFEIKTREGDKLVDYNRAVEVLAASEIHGYKDAFCVTLCHPGVDPSVPNVIANCGRLSVVESTDLGEALLRICAGEISQEQLWQWLASPGQALIDDLPFREYL